MKPISNSVLRQSLKKQRVALPQKVQQLAGELLCQRVLSWLPTHLQHAYQPLNIGLYYPIKGEIDTRPLMKALSQQNHALYLPRIHPFYPNELLFLHYTCDMPLTQNIWKIPEPYLNINHVIPFKQLDMLFVPLVSFDQMNNRMGMGGGFYDRMLQHYSSKQLFPIGLAYEFQRVTKLKQYAWDIPLPVIITPEHIYERSAMVEEKININSAE